MGGFQLFCFFGNQLLEIIFHLGQFIHSPLFFHQVMAHPGGDPIDFLQDFFIVVEDMADIK